jgi:hypothetical protein
MLEWNSYSDAARRYPFRYPDEIVAITRGRLKIEIEKNESAARRRRVEHSIAMLEDVKAKPDAVLALTQSMP